MPPVSNLPFAAHTSRQTVLGTSPDNDSGSTEPEVQPKLSKKAKKKQARHAAGLLYIDDHTNKTIENDVTKIEPGPEPGPHPPAPVAAPSLLSQIPHAFARPQKSVAPFTFDEQFTEPVGEKVSDQSTPPNDDFFREVSQTQTPSRALPIARNSAAGSPPVQPGFSTRTAFANKSPPISPPQRYARPVSYGGGIPPLPSHPRMSSSPYSRTTSQYGSPPAPHLPQQHFYHAQDIDIPPANHVDREDQPEPTLVKHTLIPSISGEPRPGVLLGYFGRISLLSIIDGGKFEEVGTIMGLPGMVVDATLMSPNHDTEQAEVLDFLVAVTLHGPKENDTLNEQTDNIPTIPGYPASAMTTTSYTTSVELYSLRWQRHVAFLLETPPVNVQSYRGTVQDEPPPIGHLKLYSMGRYVVVASGASGEVFIFAISKNDSYNLECLGKLWTNVQHQTTRRNSSHDRSTDTEISPADLNRGIAPVERALVDLTGRFLAISPANLPSRPPLHVRLGPKILCRKHNGIETITAPARPSLTCEVDSPDADTMLGKVARGVAQEIVKGARWLGDQGYQTWQNYWKKDQSPPTIVQQQQHPYSPPTTIAQRHSGAFPPTHAESVAVSKEPLIVSIYDLESLVENALKTKTDELRPLATFQPPRGCSYLSFAPNGLSLLTAGRKGDVQYVWDLMQIRHCRAYVANDENDRLRLQPRVRQVARFERLSGSTIVDIVWESPTGTRFAVLTRNRTIHVFDLPQSSLRWPPPRTIRRTNPPANLIDTPIGSQDTSQGGFFASAMTIASKAQPIVTGWRGRAPSMSGGLAGIGQTGIGFATATGARSGKAVAAGLSKSLGAASDTVSHIRHAGENRLHIKSNHEPTAGRIAWNVRGQKISLSVLDQDSLKRFRVRKGNSQDKGNKDGTSVFETRKATGTRLPQFHELRSTFEDQTRQNYTVPAEEGHQYPGFCKLEESLKSPGRTQLHPLSYAEIETNAPYQPFHSDRRVALCVFANQALEEDSHATSRPSKAGRTSASPTPWVFGDDVPLHRVNLAKAQVADDEDVHDSIIYRETTLTTDNGQEGMEHIVSTTRRGRKTKLVAESQQEGEEVLKDDFFENDCEVLDFATDRV